METTCPKCRSKKIIPEVPVEVDVSTMGSPGGGTLNVKIKGDPQAWVFKDMVSGNLSVMICGECGHAELHVSNFQLLYEKYVQSQHE